jgi:integrase
MAGVKPQANGVGAAPTLGTVGALVIDYYTSEDWNRLTPDTQRNRRVIIERFRVAHGDKRVVMLNADALERMIAKIPKAGSRVNFWKSIKPLIQSAVPRLRKDDPTKDVKTPRLPKTKGWHSWTDDEIAQFRNRWPLGTQARLVLEFALETASRRCEVVRLEPQHVKNGRIRIERAKGSKDVDIPVTPDLQAAIDAMPAVSGTFVHHDGKPYTAGSLGKAVIRWCDEAGMPAFCRLHGLKKGGMRLLAEAGATGHEIMSVSGHQKLDMVELYTADANRKKLADAAIAKRTGGKPSNKKVANRKKKSLKKRTFSLTSQSKPDCEPSAANHGVQMCAGTR